MLERLWRKGNPLTQLVGMQAGIAALENSEEVPQKVKNRAILLVMGSKEGAYCMVHCVLRCRWGGMS